MGVSGQRRVRKGNTYDTIYEGLQFYRFDFDVNVNVGLEIFGELKKVPYNCDTL